MALNIQSTSLRIFKQFINQAYSNVTLEQVSQDADPGVLNAQFVCKNCGSFWYRFEMQSNALTARMHELRPVLTNHLLCGKTEPPKFAVPGTSRKIVLK